MGVMWWFYCRNKRQGAGCIDAMTACGAPAKRGRAFRFTEAQAASFRKRVEDGEATAALAKGLKVSLPTMYNTLKRAG